jgi:hypothetical protein
LVLAALAFELGLAVVAVGLGLLLGVAPAPALAWGWRPVIVGAVATAPLLLGFSWVLRSSAAPLIRIRREMFGVLGPLVASASWPELGLIAAMAGLGEELLFRWTLLEAARSAAGAPVAVAGTSLLFGLVHFITPTYAVLATMVGVYFGALTVVTGSVAPAIVAHALYDLVALWRVSRPPPGDS